MGPGARRLLVATPNVVQLVVTLEKGNIDFLALVPSVVNLTLQPELPTWRIALAGSRFAP